MNIKLVITDLDGTLLDENKEVNPEFWEVHKKLIDKGIIFSIASGRQLYKLEEQFSQISESTLFIAENGTIVRYKGEDLHLNSMDFNDSIAIIETARKIEHCDIVLCCKNSAYLENDNPQFVSEISKFYKRIMIVDDLTKVDDVLLKVAIYDRVSSELNSYPHFKKFENDFKVAVSGPEWMDVSNFTANKGSAVVEILARLNIEREETMAFGDFLNDIEMMQVAEHSYAMKNAHPKIIEISKYITEFDNNNNGVVDTIKNKVL